MNKKQLIKDLQALMEKANADISMHAKDSNSFYGGATSSEGYSGGYAAGINDAILLINGVDPNGRYQIDRDKSVR